MASKKALKTGALALLVALGAGEAEAAAPAPALTQSVAVPEAPAPWAEANFRLSPQLNGWLRSGVIRGGYFSGWRRELIPEAMQEAWTLVFEQHPEVLSIHESTLEDARIEVTRRNGSVRSMLVPVRMHELGAVARNTVLKDNHLNRQVKGQVVQFEGLPPWDDA